MQEKKLILTLCTLLFLLMSSMALADVVVIANNSVNTDNLERKEIKKIFLGKKMYWDDNQKIVLFILNKSPAHNEFVRKYLGKSENQFTNYWKQLLFTGKGMLPQRVSEKEMLEKVKQIEGAIGYAPDNLAINGVKIVRVK